MTMHIDRRTLLGATAAGTALALSGARLAAQTASAERPDFGPAAGEALLSRNENPFGPAPSAIAAITENASKGCYYADGGLRHLTAMIAERHGVAPEQVVVGSGSTEILSAAALAFANDGGILCPGLFWDTTVRYAENKGATAVRVPLAEDMSVDLAAMESLVTPDIALVQICNPNNPTGLLIDGETMRGFVGRVGPQATVLVDEAYNELTTDPEGSSVVSLVREGANLIVCRTFSKIYGMAGLRVGYALTTPELAERIRGYLMSFGGNTAGLAGAIASYNDDAFLTSSKQRILEARGIILEAVEQAGLSALPSETNFVYVNVPDADAVRAGMAERGIMIRGAYGPWTQWSRVSTGKIEDVRRYAAALPEVVGA